MSDCYPTDSTIYDNRHVFEMKFVTTTNSKASHTWCLKAKNEKEARP